MYIRIFSKLGNLIHGIVHTAEFSPLCYSMSHSNGERQSVV